jgi:hypothetical protein
LAHSIQSEILGRFGLQIPVLPNSSVEGHHLVGRKLMAAVPSLVEEHKVVASTEKKTGL